ALARYEAGHGKSSAAISFLRNLLHKLESNPEDPSLPEARHALAEACISSGKFTEAESLLLDQLSAEHDIKTAMNERLLRSIAELYLRQNLPDKAAPYVEDFVDSSFHSPSSPVDPSVELLSALAESYIKKKDYLNAYQHLYRARRICEHDNSPRSALCG